MHSKSRISHKESLGDFWTKRSPYISYDSSGEHSTPLVTPELSSIIILLDLRLSPIHFSDHSIVQNKNGLTQQGDEIVKGKIGIQKWGKGIDLTIIKYWQKMNSRWKFNLRFTHHLFYLLRVMCKIAKYIHTNPFWI